MCKGITIVKFSVKTGRAVKKSTTQRSSKKFDKSAKKEIRKSRNFVQNRMAKRTTESVSMEQQDDDDEAESLSRSNSLYGIDISVDKIEDRLYLGNLACARNTRALEGLGITHVLTIDVVPLPRVILERPFIKFYFLKLADVPKEDIISNLPITNSYIRDALERGGTMLVHCVFGVSRSAAIVIAYIMEKYEMDYEDALALVKSKRSYVHPNPGFTAQLKLFGHMHYTLNRDDPRYKQFRLKMAGQKLKEVKILPQMFADLVKPDPGLIRERPEPIVYRCKKCRRIVASQNNIIPHIPRPLKVEQMKRNMRPKPSQSGLKTASGQVLIEKLNSLANEINSMVKLTKSDVVLTKQDAESALKGSAEPEGEGEDGSRDLQNGEGSSSCDLEEESSEGHLVDTSVVSRDTTEVCRQMWFVEPMLWMREVQHETQGKLYCTKCHVKIGSFSWTMGCRCPCGQKVAPAFYLVPSKVEWSNFVQNVQVTV